MILRKLLGTLKDLFADRPVQPIIDLQALQQFLDTRASHVTQTTLYGYLRTRAGSRYPELFANEDFAMAINAAKWNIWVACLSDLSIYAGGLISRRGESQDADTARVVTEAVEAILQRTGVPEEADGEFSNLVVQLRERLNGCSWRSVPDNDMAFSLSPAALVRWAPIVDQLKNLDEDIVKNSVRFRWQEVRRELRASLDAEALLANCAQKQT